MSCVKKNRRNIDIGHPLWLIMDGTPTQTYALTVYREYGDRDENGDLIYEAQTYDNYDSEDEAFEAGLNLCIHSERLNKITITREDEYESHYETETYTYTCKVDEWVIDTDILHRG